MGREIINKKLAHLINRGVAIGLKSRAAPLFLKTEVLRMHCPNCHSKQLAEIGFNTLGKQIYRCKECDRQFVFNSEKELILINASFKSDDLLHVQFDQENFNENQTAVDGRFLPLTSRQKTILLVTIMTISGLFSTAWLVWPCYFLWGCAGQEPNPSPVWQVENLGSIWVEPSIQDEFKRACEARISVDACRLDQPPTISEMNKLVACEKNPREIESGNAPVLTDLFFLAPDLEEILFGNKSTSKIDCNAYRAMATNIRRAALAFYQEISGPSGIVKNNVRQAEFANVLGFGNLLDAAQRIIENAKKDSVIDLPADQSNLPFFTENETVFFKYLRSVLNVKSSSFSLKQNVDDLYSLYDKESAGEDSFFAALGRLKRALEIQGN